jgi:hypothetical protein
MMVTNDDDDEDALCIYDLQTLFEQNFDAACLLTVVVSLLATSRSTTPSTSTTTTTPSSVATTTITTAPSASKQKKRHRDDNNNDDDDDDKRCCAERWQACVVAASCVGACNPSHKCQHCRRPLHPPCGQRGNDEDDIVCAECAAAHADAGDAHVASHTTATTTVATTTTTATVSLPGRAVRVLRSKAKTGKAFQLQFVSPLIENIIAQQLRVTNDGSDRLVKYAIRSSIEGLRGGFRLRATTTNDKYDGRQLLFLSARVPASMRQQVYDVHLWLRVDGSIAFAECACQMGRAGCHHVVAVLYHLSTIVIMPGALGYGLMMMMINHNVQTLVRRRFVSLRCLILTRHRMNKNVETRRAVETLVRVLNPDLDDVGVGDFMRAGTDKLSLDTLRQIARAQAHTEVIRIRVLFLRALHLNRREQPVGCPLRDVVFSNPKQLVKKALVDGPDAALGASNAVTDNRLWDQYAPISRAAIVTFDYARLASSALGNNNSMASLLIQLRHVRQQLQQQQEENNRRQLRPRPPPATPPAPPSPPPRARAQSASGTHARRVCQYPGCECNEKTCINGSQFVKMPKKDSGKNRS